MVCNLRDKCRSYTIVNETLANDSSSFIMARRKRNFHLIAGLIVGLFLGYLVKISIKSVYINSRTLETNGHGHQKCVKSLKKSEAYSKHTEEPQVLEPLKIIGMTDDNENVHNSKRSLLFVGVMTADKYLDSRAAAVYKTWGKNLPGRLAFFSSKYSRSSYLPLVPLQGVDDSYPPQKKSFMMLLYMHDNFIDRFEWFLRADDDLFIKTDKLERLLRSVDSRKPQFIGQAGRGNTEEFGFLSLEYDENFCMGGPGVILSRETLKRIAPHIKECLKNLYTTHEDVELGRCVQKFAGIPCTWSYEMQSILYHNSSGNLAFTGSLKKKEVHHAITMHPIKDPKHMYRINTYLKNLKVQQLKEVAMSLHRDILAAAKELIVPTSFISSYYIAESVPLYPRVRGDPYFLGDTRILGVAPSLNRYNPTEVKDVLIWNHLSKMIYTIDSSNPRKRLEVSLLESLDDIIRELMEIINGFSKQRGRVIEFKEILYGYQRMDPIHGADYVLDILLVYKKYRGRKMTVPVRRHVYLQQSFTDINIREVPLGEPPTNEPLTEETNQKVDYDVDHVYPQEDLGGSANSIPFINFKKFNVPIRGVLETGIMKLSENLPNVFKYHQDDEYNKKSSKKINFILPLSGRYDVFVRFMKNYEKVCLISDKQTSIVIALYNDKNHPSDFDKTVNLVNLYSRKYPYSEIKLIIINDSQFSRGLSLEKGVEKCEDHDLLFFIDVDIVFNAESLQRIRLNTIRHYTAYFPIVYSEYDPSVVNNVEYNIVKTKNSNTNSVVLSDDLNMKSYKDTYFINHIDQENSDDYGYFRQFGFGIASVYKSDFVSVGGFNTEIKGWGLEDVHLFDKFVKSNISIFRAVDIGLVHVFHPVDCDKNLDLAQYRMCIGTRTNTFGSTKHMTIYILNHQNLLPKVGVNSISDKPKVVPPSR